jgi:hypothetical protein
MTFHLMVALLLSYSQIAVGSDKRLFGFDDLARILDVSDPRISPEGDWVAYVLSGVDAERDQHQSDIWMISWDGAKTVQLTHTDASESQPRFSPDGRYLAFLSSRKSGAEDDEKSQIMRGRRMDIASLLSPPTRTPMSLPSTRLARGKRHRRSCSIAINSKPMVWDIFADSATICMCTIWHRESHNY